MADDIKKVGLVFTSEGVVDFKKSIQQVNSSLQENRSEFKLAKSQWDDSTKASQKLADTNKYLTSMYDDSATKVKALTLELDELENAEERNEVAIMKKKTQLNGAVSMMNNYKKGVDETNAKLKAGTADLEQYAKKLDAIGTKTKDVGKKVTTGLTLPIMAVGSGAMVAWNEVDKAYDNIVAGTGATGDALEGLKESFENVYGSFPEDAGTVSTAIADINTRLGFTGDSLDTATEDFLMFAKVNNTDVSTAIETVSRAMADAGIANEEYNEVLDILTASSQASGISVDKLAESVTKYGAPMRALGFEMGESIALFAQWEKTGVNTEIAFSGMKKAISNWSDAGKDAKVEFQKTLETIAGAPDIATATTLAIETFGAKAGPDLADAIQGGRFSVEEMMKTVESASGTVENSFENMQDPIDQSQVALNNLKLVGADFGDTLMTALAPILETITQMIIDLKDWFTGLDDGMKNNIMIVGMVIAAIGPLIFIVGTLASSISAIITLFTTVSGIMSALGLPIAGLMGPIGALIAIFVVLMATCDEFRNNVFDIFNNIKEIFKGLIDFVVGIFTGDWNRAWNGIGRVVSNVFGAIGNVVKAGMNGSIAVVNGMINGVEAGINFVISGLNRIKFSMPSWVPIVGGKSFGINLRYANLPNIKYLAKGGDLTNGIAMVGEAGPELLMQKGNRTTVAPLSRGGGANPVEIVDYDKMAQAMLKVFKYMRIEVDGDEIGKIIDERMLVSI